MADTEQKRTILIVEDEPDIVRGLRDVLEFEGFKVVSAGEGKPAVRLAAAEQPALIILDLMLPDINGYQVCEQVRRTNPTVPIIILSARGQESDKIRGLEAGADDYVTKPFGVGELIARVRAILRRSQRQSPGEPDTFRIGKAVVNLRTQQLTKGRTTHVLSFYELELLKLLHEHAGTPVGRDEILDKVWGVEAFPTNRTVDNFVVKLRKKIEDDPAEPRHILTIYGQGYKLVP